MLSTLPTGELDLTSCGSAKGLMKTNPTTRPSANRTCTQTLAWHCRSVFLEVSCLTDRLASLDFFAVHLVIAQQKPYRPHPNEPRPFPKPITHPRLSQVHASHISSSLSRLLSLSPFFVPCFRPSIHAFILPSFSCSFLVLSCRHSHTPRSCLPACVPARLPACLCTSL